MRIDPAGWPFILGAAVITAFVWLLMGAVLGVPLLVVSSFLLFFFRDPDRVHDAPPSAVLSPADGRVMVAGEPTGEATPPGNWQQVSVFLSPMDVHVNRIPVSGRVIRVEYHPGRFLPAYKKESGDLNERSEVTIDHAGQPIVVRQIVGVLARRVVCRTREGLNVKAGERYGVMKFGSRMDVFVPADAILRVRVGDTVVGGVTVIATLTSAKTTPGVISERDEWKSHPVS
ncbi:MAG TPA: phosphatidylserine decarboxylase [Vicinamibacterales bacterium]|nr:phosphatidylserine decarboxylase [Vicinamibacterales bacterium]